MVIAATVESPYSASDDETRIRNQRYSILALEWVTRKSEAAYASHLQNTLHAQHNADVGRPLCPDNCDAKYNVVSRDAAIELTMEMRTRMDKGYFFMDFGESRGMKAARDYLTVRGIPCEDVQLASSPYWQRWMRDCGVVAE